MHTELTFLDKSAVQPDAAAALIRGSWGENQDTAFDYSESFLKSYFEYPGGGVIVPAIYQNGLPVAIACGMPRAAVLNGRPVRLILVTFVTVASQLKGQGLGKAIFGECLRQAREAGYDGAIHYCVHGNVSNHVTVSSAQAMGFNVTEMKPVRFLQKLITADMQPKRVRPEISVAEFLGAAALIQQSLGLARTWTEPEAEWQTVGRPGTCCVTESQDCGPAAIAGYCIQARDVVGTRCMMIDDVLWDTIDTQSREALLKKFTLAASNSADLLVLPLLGYADETPFRAAGFRMARRCLHAYLTLWDDRVDCVCPQSFYMDVI